MICVHVEHTKILTKVFLASISRIKSHIKPCLPFLFPKGCLQPVGTPESIEQDETPSMSANFWSAGVEDLPRLPINVSFDASLENAACPLPLIPEHILLALICCS